MKEQSNRHNEQRLSFDDVIAEDNIRRRGEIIAIRAVDTIRGKAGDAVMQKIFGDLLDDIKNIDVPGYVLTGSYDIVQEAMLFLCGYIGRKLTDIIIDKDGEPITILTACFRVVNVYTKRWQRRANNNMQIDDITRPQMPVPFEKYIPIEEDYTSVNEKIQAMKLNRRQAEVLSYRMSGRGITETGRIMSLSRGNVRYALECMRQKYINAIGMPQSVMVASR